MTTKDDLDTYHIDRTQQLCTFFLYTTLTALITNLYTASLIWVILGLFRQYNVLLIVDIG